MSKKKWAATMKTESVQLVSTPLEKGPTHIVQSLIGIYGPDSGQVINYIVKSWIGQNIEMLGKMGIQLISYGGRMEINRFDK